MDKLRSFFTKRRLIIYSSAIAAAAVIVAAAFCLFAFAGGGLYCTLTRSLDLSDRPLADTTQLGRFRMLRELDVSGTGITGLDGLEKLRRLEHVDISRNPIPAADIIDYRVSLPNGCSLEYSVMLGDEYIDADAEEVVLTDETAKFCNALLLLENLKVADIRDCRMSDVILAVSNSSLRSFEWKVNICSSDVMTDVRELVLDSPTDDDLSKLALFSSLDSVSVTGALPESLTETAAAMPDTHFLWSVDLCGTEVTNETTELNISGTNISDPDEFAQKLKFLPKLTYIDMCGCGLSNEQMGALREQFPDIKFVWLVTFGCSSYKWTVRTDITCFSTLGKFRCTDEDLAPLLTYCTDLVALDLGHNKINYLASFKNLTHLKALILMDNDIRDLPEIKALQELEYIEIYSSRLYDISPIAELPNLEDVNIGNNHITDITPFLGMKQLRRLWITDCNLSNAQISQLKEALPNCDIYTFSKNNPGYMWRYDERNTAIRQAFNNWENIVKYTDWDDIEYREGADLIEMHMVY